MIILKMAYCGDCVHENEVIILKMVCSDHTLAIQLAVCMFTLVQSDLTKIFY